MMVSRFVPRTIIFAVGFASLLARGGFAQSGIAGLVRDTSGAVMPGVTVEASSPALIEKARSVSTNGEGRYSVSDLRPGVYVITFSLSGFTTVRRDGVELPAGFTATVNIQMRVGALQETVTVSGQSPLVDVESVTKQAVFSKTLADFLPTNRTPQGFIPLIPGVVGGLNVSGVESRAMSIHGSRSGESLTAIDGFPDVMARSSGGGSSTFYLNPLNIQELSVEVGGGPAERQSSGIFTNMIPKEGGNKFAGTFYALFSNGATETDNLTDALRAKGLTSVNGLKDSWDVSGAVGGPIQQDRLWFFASLRNSDLTRYIAGLYYNKNPKGWTYEPDLNRQAVIKIRDDSRHLRLTWQPTPRNKVSASYEIQPHTVFQRAYSALRSPETTAYTPYIPNYFAQVVWKAPVTSRLLVEAGVARVDNDYNGRRQNEKGGVVVDTETLSKTEQSTGLVFGSTPASGDAYGHHKNLSTASRASVAYVTGSHQMKIGLFLKQGSVVDTAEKNGDMAVTLLNGVPRTLTLQATPWEMKNEMKADLGVYAQDRWTYRRAAVSYGLRYDYYNGTASEMHLPAARFVPARDFPEVKNVPNYKDLSPRLGVSYDLFGNGKTAVKTTVGRYVAALGTSNLTQLVNPVQTSVVSTNRTWNDNNRDYVPDCDLNNPFLNGECAQISDLNFGKANPKATQFDDDVLHGFGKREYNWETSVELQHQLSSGVSASAGYHRRWFGNKTVTDNQLVAPGDYSPYCVTAPVDQRLPGGGGNQLCGYFDLSQSKFGQSQNIVTYAKNFGASTEIYDGFDFSARARLPGTAQFSAGVSTGRTATNTCFIVDSPQALLFCDVRPPFQPNIKAFGVYPLPWWGLQTSATFQSVPGPGITANRAYTNSEIAPTLLRNLSSGTVTLPLIKPGTMYSDRVNELDFRVARNITISGRRILVNLDVFNILNRSDVQLHNATYGSAWLRPTQILNGRTFQFSGQIDF